MNDTHQQDWVEEMTLQATEGRRLEHILGVILWVTLVAILVLVG